jgi:hypothetical protein
LFGPGPAGDFWYRGTGFGNPSWPTYSFSQPSSGSELFQEKEGTRTISLSPSGFPGLQRVWDIGREETGLFLEKALTDFRNNYWGPRLFYLGGTIGLAGIIANTHVDQGFRDWYQHHVRQEGMGDWARVFNRLGQHEIVVPIYGGAWILGRSASYLRPDSVLGERGRVLGDWGERTMRGLLVGSPSVGILQVTLGASRPDDIHSSRWRPFRDNNAVSGHVFVGAVPFLTAARMTDNLPLKGIFFAGSFATFLSRLNNDDHYLSQLMLGWTIAFLSVQSVYQTDVEIFRRIEIFPLAISDTPGVGIQVRY